MPLTRISVPQHLNATQRRGLADAVHTALVATCNVPEDDRFQLITRYTPMDMHINPTFPDVQRTADASIVEILFLHGRTPEQKRALYQRIVQQAALVELTPDDIMVALTENSAIDWSCGGGRAYSKAYA